MQNLLLGIDIGGTSIKAGLFDIRGNLLGSSQIENSIISLKPGWAELSPTFIWKIIPGLIGECCNSAGTNTTEINSLGFSTTCPTVVPLDKNGNPLRNIIMNFDLRSNRQVDETLKKIKEEKIMSITGNKLLSGAISVSSILWIKENEPEIYGKTYYFGHVTSYLIYKLTGRMVLDYTQASFSGFFRINGDFTWDQDLLDIYGVDIKKLPELLPPDRTAGTLTEKAAQITGLKKGTVVAASAADTVCSALGIGLSESNKVFISSGTSEIVSGCLSEPGFDYRFLNRFYIDHLWIFHGAISTSGAAINWLKNIFEGENNIGRDDFYESIIRLAKGSATGSNKLIFLPYLQGERSPLWDSSAKGVLMGLTLNTEKKDIIRAVFESIGFALKQNIKIAEKLLKKEFKEVLITGGGGKNRFWLQIKSNIIGKALLVQNFGETAMLGAAMLGGISGNIYDNYTDAIEKAAKTDYFIIRPEIGEYEKYQKLSRIYDSLYKTLKHEFKELDKIGLDANC